MAFTPEGLANLRAGLERHLAQGYAPGVVAVVSRGAESHVLPLGTRAVGGSEPMQRDTIFRIASMTKAVTAVATLMLIEDGKLRLDEPVDRLLPELANRRVLRTLASPLDDTVPARRPITVEDLLSFRLGWGIVLAPPGTYPIQKPIADLELAGFGMPNPARPYGPDEWLRRLGTLPLMAQPGEQWLYTTGSNVLGVLIARASGQALDAFFQDRILGPLAMQDTGFSVPASKLDRFCPEYMARDGKLAVFDPATPDSPWTRRPQFLEGDAGLVSTADDYLAFARMLLAGGVHAGSPLISEASVKAMTTDQLTAAQRAGGAMFLGPGHGWGYGVAVVTEPRPDGQSVGTYGWNGGLGTSWISDPGKGLTAMLLTQRFFDSPDLPAIHKDFQTAAYRALA